MRSSDSQVRFKDFNVMLRVRRQLGQVRAAARSIDALLAGSAGAPVAPAAVEELAQLGCQLIELAAALAERDDPR